MPERIPQSVLRTWPSIPADAWERLSEHRWRAPHADVEGHWHVAVAAFGETVVSGSDLEHQAEVFAGLFDTAARLASHRVSCEEGTPVVRPDDKANARVAGRCWWCGKYPAEHVTSALEADDA